MSNALDDARLWQAARMAREHAHAPFSGFKVGAALELRGGEIIGGCNVENATYGLTLCAERVAIFKAISEGKREFARLCVVTDADRPTSPCGACRQIIWEFCGDIEVLLGNAGGITARHSMRELFPAPFDSDSL